MAASYDHLKLSADLPAENAKRGVFELVKATGRVFPMGGQPSEAVSKLLKERCFADQTTTFNSNQELPMGIWVSPDPAVNQLRKEVLKRFAQANGFCITHGLNLFDMPYSELLDNVYKDTRKQSTHSLSGKTVSNSARKMLADGSIQLTDGGKPMPLTGFFYDEQRNAAALEKPPEGFQPILVTEMASERTKKEPGFIGNLLGAKPKVKVTQMPITVVHVRGYRLPTTEYSHSLLGFATKEEAIEAAAAFCAQHSCFSTVPLEERVRQATPSQTDSTYMIGFKLRFGTPEAEREALKSGIVKPVEVPPEERRTDHADRIDAEAAALERYYTTGKW